MSTATITTAVRTRASAGRSAIASSIPALWVLWLSVANLAVTGTVLLLIFVVSERWWVAAAITYLPRLPWALPSLVFGVAAIAVHPRSLWPNAIALGLVLGPLMELRVPGVMNAPSQARAPQLNQTLRVV